MEIILAQYPLFMVHWLWNSVTDESFVDETRVWRKYKFNPGIYDEFIYNHWVDATAGGVLIPLGYHQPSSQQFCADMNYHWYDHNYKSTVNKTLNFRNTKAFHPRNRLP